jgi:SAM-dependent methyltransferase
MSQMVQQQNDESDDSLPGATAGPEVIRSLYSRPNDVQYTWDRHTRLRRAETVVTSHVLEAFLPPPPSRIVDVGGGNGFWYQYLTDRGFATILCDLSMSLLRDAVARGKQRSIQQQSVVRCDGRQLPYQSSSFDACLCFGPLYCVPPSDLPLVLDEVIRVLRPGGIAIFEILTKAAAIRSLLAHAPKSVARVDWDQFWTSGRIDAAGLPPLLRLTSFADPPDIIARLALAGFIVRSTVGVDGPYADYQHRLAAAEQYEVEGWAAVSERFSDDPHYWGSCNHVLLIADKPVAGWASKTTTPPTIEPTPPTPTLKENPVERQSI